jgi:YtcA family
VGPFLSLAGATSIPFIITPSARLWRAAPLLLLDGCAVRGAPSFPLVGAYFPDWMLCAMLGIAVSVMLRVVFVPTGIDAVLNFRLFTYVSLGLIAAFLAWLAWFGP